jgi:hypothetical protein
VTVIAGSINFISRVFELLTIRRELFELRASRSARQPKVRVYRMRRGSA